MLPKPQLLHKNAIIFDLKSLYDSFGYNIVEIDYEIEENDTSQNIVNLLFNINEGKYNVSNSYWKSYSILKEIDKITDKDKLKILKKVDFITKNYDEFSQIYQNFKDNNKIPLK